MSRSHWADLDRTNPRQDALPHHLRAKGSCPANPKDPNPTCGEDPLCLRAGRGEAGQPIGKAAASLRGSRRPQCPPSAVSGGGAGCGAQGGQGSLGWRQAQRRLRAGRVRRPGRGLQTWPLLPPDWDALPHVAVRVRARAGGWGCWNMGSLGREPLHSPFLAALQRCPAFLGSHHPPG